MRFKTVAPLICGLVLALIAVPAAAQGTDTSNAPAAVTASTTPAVDSSSASSIDLMKHVSFATDDQTQRGTPTHQMGGKQVLIMVQGGYEHASGENGFFGGIGANFKPVKDNDMFEVGADFNIGHASGGGEGATLIYISFNGQYDIHMKDSKTVPFVGAGVGIVRLSSSGFSNTETKFQILGGVAFAMQSGREVRAQVRFIFTEATTTILMVGFAF